MRQVQDQLAARAKPTEVDLQNYAHPDLNHRGTAASGRQTGRGQRQQNVTTFGLCELGHLHLAASKKAMELWPAHDRDIRAAAARALNFRAKPDWRAGAATSDSAAGESKKINFEMLTATKISGMVVGPDGEPKVRLDF